MPRWRISNGGVPWRETSMHDFRRIFGLSSDTRRLHASGAAAQLGESAATLRNLATLAADEVFTQLSSAASGLESGEAAKRLRAQGANDVARVRQQGAFGELLRRSINPLNGVLLSLAAVSVYLGERRAAILILVMVVLSVGLGFVQEHRSNKSADALRRMVRTTATVRRREPAAENGHVEVPIEDVVPGDIVLLSAGDMVPADLRLISAKNLFVNQSALTGESMPVEKSALPVADDTGAPFDLANICFTGTSVLSGTGWGVVALTGPRTAFGHVAGMIAANRVLTSFDRGIARFTWMMIGLIAIMVPLVFLINGLTKGDWFEALLFAVAVAVGLTPEMLPMIVTVNLAKGAIEMAKKRAIVKRLDSIQNFGAMDVLCTDKTGTLTQDRIIVKRHLDVHGDPSDRALEYAYLNSLHQSGLKNLLDVAVLQHVEMEERINLSGTYVKIDEIPFDFERRRMSVVLSRGSGERLLICKGAVEEVFAACTRYATDTDEGLLDSTHFAQARSTTAALNADGFRLVAVACKRLPEESRPYTASDEAELTLVGYIAFLDPPKETCAAALAALSGSGIRVKILTGDNDIVTRKVCHDVGLRPGRIVLGRDIESMSPQALGALAEEASVFAKVSPAQKASIIEALRGRGHVVGFLGDGINDGPALKVADVGVSVDSAVDIAKESADIILLEKSLAVLNEGVLEGRKVFGNITKYIKMGASSNFGNMFSVLGASLFLPFLPMAPIQVLTNNLLYDLSQAAIPLDNVDEDYLARPRRWDIGNIFRFVVLIGPVSSVFDYLTFFMMLYVFRAWNDAPLFQTGWFVESLMSQTLIIHIIRTAKIPFVESRASVALIATSLAIAVFGMILPYVPLAGLLGFVPLPGSYWAGLFVILTGYAMLTHVLKRWFVRRFGLN